VKVWGSLVKVTKEAKKKSDARVYVLVKEKVRKFENEYQWRSRSERKMAQGFCKGKTLISTQRDLTNCLTADGY
jgi:hypothetical protein